jgi:hypothetical protein
MAMVVISGDAVDCAGAFMFLGIMAGGERWSLGASVA